MPRIVFFEPKAEKRQLGHRRAPKYPKKLPNGDLGVALGVQNVPWGDPGDQKWGPWVLNGALGVPFRVQNESLGGTWGDPGAPKWVPWGLLGSPWDTFGHP